MPDTTDTTSARSSTNPHGHRPLTAAHVRARRRAEAARERGGLPAGESPWAVITALKAYGGRDGWTDPLVRTLELLIAPIPDAHWRTGRPVNWRPVKTLSAERGLSPRAFRNHVNRLMELGAVAYNDSPNCHRYRKPGAGDEDVYGIDLAPCILLLEEARVRAAELRAERNAIDRLRHRASALRRQIRGALFDPGSRGALGERAAAIEGDLQAIDPGRLDRLARAVLESLVERLGALLTLCEQLIEAAASAVDEVVDKSLNSFARDTNSFRQGGTQVPPLTTLQPDSVPLNSCSPQGSDQNDRSGSPSTAQLVEALPPPIARILPRAKRIEGTIDIADIVAACRAYRPRLGISVQAWRDAEAMIGPALSAVVFVITAARNDPTWPEDRRVHTPGGFFRSLSRLAAGGRADLAASIHGIVERNLAPRRDGTTARGCW